MVLPMVDPEQEALMSLIHIAGRIHRRAQKNRDGTYTYYYRRHVGFLEGGQRKPYDLRIRVGHSLEYALKSQRQLDLEHEARMRGEVPQREVTVEEMAGEYLGRVTHLVSYKGIRSSLQKFGAFCGRAPVAGLTWMDMQRFVLHCQRNLGLKAATVNSVVADLKPAFGYAVSMGYLERNPVLAVRRLEEPRSERRFPRPDELGRVLRECKPWLARILRAQYMTGARPGEVLRMDWAHVDFEGGRLILIRTKNRRHRPAPFEVTMPSQLKTMLQEMAQERGNPTEGLVFVNGHGKPYPIGQVFIPLKRLVRRLGMPWFNLQGLRKMAATEIEERTGDIRVAQAQLGHARITTTELYVQRNRGAKEKAAKVIESLAAEVEDDPAGGNMPTGGGKMPQ
jgi:integrase